MISVVMFMSNCDV